jgi:hypothetical protein
MMRQACDPIRRSSWRRAPCHPVLILPRSQPSHAWRTSPIAVRCCAWGRRWPISICASFRQVPKSIVLDIDDTFDAVHGGQQLRLFNAHHDDYGFQPRSERLP